MSEHRSRHHHHSRSTVGTDLTKDQLNEIEEAFKIFDIDRSGTIQCQELKSALRAMGFDLGRKEIEEIMREKDPKGKNELSKEAFIDICGRLIKKRDPLKEIKRLFLLFSSDHEFITKKDLKKIAKELGEEMTDPEIDEMVTRFDKDKDGKINEAEFIAIMDPAKKYN